MNYEDFVCFVQTKMQEKLGKEVQVELHRVVKNNAVEMDGLSIHEKESNISPTIYLNEFYEQYQSGMTMPEIVDYIQEMYRKSRIAHKVDTEFFWSFDKVRPHLVCKLVNLEKNRERLKEIPHIPFLDLALVCYYKMEDSEIGNGTILVYESHRRQWGIDSDEMFRIARDNTLMLLPEEFINMDHFFPSKPDAPPMYVLTNEENCFGAVNMIFDSVLTKAGEMMKEDFWVLPSSVHECVLVAGSLEMEQEELEEMVHRINAKEVSPEDFLSDSVYYYRRTLHRLEKM